MLLSRLLHTGVIRMKLGAVDKKECIAELVDLLVQAKEIPMSLRHTVLDAVMDREATMSTGMEHGVALPHGSTECVPRVIAALGLSPKGIPFDSLDGLRANLVILLILPKSRFQVQVHTWASIAHLLESPKSREILLGAKTPKEVINLIMTREESEVHNSRR